MTEKATITSDFPTPSEVASRLHIPASRVAELRLLLADVRANTGDGPAAKTIKGSRRRIATRSKKK